METRSLQADILIIGGGSAGCMAANRSLELDPTLKVVIFEKGDIKYSGSIARGMDALNIVAIPNFTTPELYVESNTLNCGGVMDAPPNFEMARRSFDLLKKLEGWGVYFPQDEKGNYRTLQYHPIGKFLTAMEEPDLKVIISEKALGKGSLAVNRTMGLRLLLDDGRVAGAVGINVRTGDLVVCQARTVILASGGTARFGLPNSGYLYGTFDFPGNTGDGFVMGFEAGASLTGMEYSRRVTLIKDVNIPLLAITITRGGRMLDIFDDILMEGSCHDLSKPNQAVNAGRGPLRIRLSHLPQEVIEEIESILFTTERPVQERFFKGRNINFRKDDIELWPTEHQLCGGHGMSGLVVNERAETKIPGLYAAGDVSCVAKGHLTGAFVFGEIAGEEAVRFCASQPPPKFDPDQVDRLGRTIERRSNRADKRVQVQDIEYKMRRLINDYVVSPKNAYKLNRWLDWAERFTREIEEEVAVNNGHELFKLFEVENILKCATFSAVASL
ncbi:MAG: FAD-binding protein, partial [Deltaproteobacteria bacterium]|nr:FAD-binding protein [Deltaproteobacteria bacterium]